MKFWIVIFSIFVSISSFGNQVLSECKKNDDILSFSISKHVGDGPMFLYGLRLNNSLGEEGYQAFKELLRSSPKCEDLNNYVRKIEKEEAFLCVGEVIAPNGIYGQIILSHGALDTFKNIIASAAGWTCGEKQLESTPSNESMVKKSCATNLPRHLHFC